MMAAIVERLIPEGTSGLPTHPATPAEFVGPVVGAISGSKSFEMIARD